MEKMYKTDEGNFVCFYYDTAKNNIASDKEGRPIYDKILFVRIVASGQAKSEVIYEVEREFQDGSIRANKNIYNRFEEYIEKFKSKNEGGDLKGTPIEQWPAIDVRTAAELKAQNIFTVESLAELSDTGLQNIGMGGRALQAKAKAFLDAAKGGAEYEKLAADNQKLQDRIEILEKQIKELGQEETMKRKKAS